MPIEQLELPAREGSAAAQSGFSASLVTPEGSRVREAHCRDPEPDRRLPEAIGHLSPAQRVIYAELNGSPLTDRQIAEAAGFFLRSTRDHLAGLAAEGLAEQLDRYSWRRA